MATSATRSVHLYVFHSLCTMDYGMHAEHRVRAPNHQNQQHHFDIERSSTGGFSIPSVKLIISITVSASNSGPSFPSSSKRFVRSTRQTTTGRRDILWILWCQIVLIELTMLSISLSVAIFCRSRILDGTQGIHDLNYGALQLGR